MASWQEWQDRISEYMPKEPNFRPDVYGPLTKQQDRFQGLAEDALEMGTSFTGGALKGPYIRRFAAPTLGPNALSKGRRQIMDGMEKTAEFGLRSSGADSSHDALPMLRGASDPNQVMDFLTRKGREISSGTSDLHAFMSAEPGTPFKLTNPDAHGAEGLKAQKEAIAPVEDESKELRENEEVENKLQQDVANVVEPDQAMNRAQINTVDLPAESAALAGGDSDVAQGQESAQPAGTLRTFASDFELTDMVTAPLQIASNLAFGSEVMHKDGTSSGFAGLLGGLGIGPGAKARMDNAVMAGKMQRQKSLNANFMRIAGEVTYDDPAMQEQNKRALDLWESESMVNKGTLGTANTAESSLSALGAFLFRDRSDQQDDLARNFNAHNADVGAQEGGMKALAAALAAGKDDVRFREGEQDDAVRDAQLSISQDGNARGWRSDARQETRLGSDLFTRDYGRMEDILYPGGEGKGSVSPGDSIALKQGDFRSTLSDPKTLANLSEVLNRDTEQGDFQDAINAKTGLDNEGEPFIDYDEQDSWDWTGGDSVQEHELRVRPGAHEFLPDPKSVRGDTGGSFRNMRGRVQEMLAAEIITEETADNYMELITRGESR